MEQISYNSLIAAGAITSRELELGKTYVEFTKFLYHKSYTFIPNSCTVIYISEIGFTFNNHYTKTIKPHTENHYLYLETTNPFYESYITWYTEGLLVDKLQTKLNNDFKVTSENKNEVIKLLLDNNLLNLH